MVGSEQGQVYKGKQGIQYATILDSSKIADKIAALGLQAKAAKAKDADEGAKITMDFKPAEVWHYYSAEATKRYEDWAKKGASLMTAKGINNLWNSTDPEAVNWQLEGARLKQGYANIKQAQDQWIKSMDQVRQKGDEYTPEYLQSLEYFPANVSFDQIAAGNFNWPQAEFKNPTQIFQRFLTTDLKSFQGELDGRPPKPEEVQARVNTYFSTPEHENDANGMRQMYGKLTQTEQTKMQDLARQLGYNDPSMALAHTMYEDRLLTKPQNMQEDANKYAADAPYESKATSIEDTRGVTKASEVRQLKDPKYPMAASTSHFAQKDYLLDDAEYLSTLGVDIKLPREERKKLAIKEFAQRIKDSTEKESSFTIGRDMGADGYGFTEKEETTSLDNWYADLTSKDATKSEQAANWLYGVQLPGTEGAISSAKVMRMGNEAGIPLSLRVNFKDAKTARQARESIVGYMNEMDTAKMSPQEKASYDAMMSSLQKAGGETIVIGITEANMQVLKEMHRKSAQTKKSLYQIGYEQQVLPTPGEPPKATWSKGETPAPKAPAAQRGLLNNPGG